MKKSLGQNFLIDNNIIKKIMMLQIFIYEILEVGPGSGNLTESNSKKKPKKFLLSRKIKIFVLFSKKNLLTR